MNPTKSKYTILAQLCTYIPGHIVQSIAEKYGVDKKARSYSPWSHVVTMLYAQLAHSLSLNDVSDNLHAHASALFCIRGATPPSRNNLSHANKFRDAAMAEELFWKMMEHLQNKNASFGFYKKYSGLPKNFKRTIYAVDSTVIELFAGCMSWAKHRRRKAAAKCHMSLNMQTFLPQFAIITSAASHDSTQARALCNGLKSGEIVVFDRAYVDYKHLYDLDSREVFWVTRTKSSMNYKVMGQHSEAKGNIHKDIRIRLKNKSSDNSYPEEMRLIEATVIIDGKEKRMTFITNNFEWSAKSICELYKCRWGIEVFFKQIKQTLQLADFLGQSENAIRWQIWTALLTYLLVRFVSFVSTWTGSFSRLFTLLRGSIWSRYEIFAFAKIYGTAGGPPRTIGTPSAAYLPGLSP